jgi:hypothetical protein
MSYFATGCGVILATFGGFVEGLGVANHDPGGLLPLAIVAFLCGLGVVFNDVRLSRRLLDT